MLVQDLTTELQNQVAQAVATRTPLNILGGNSKTFYGGNSNAACHPLPASFHSGMITYDPSELVVTARAGTPIAALQTQLAEQGQMLGFEPPHFGPHATLGGCIATGFSGPRRPYAGSARDFVLGCRLINGQAEVLHFGGQVIKNVAGFDVSRLMVGAMGQLGVLLDISLRLLPLPEAEITLCLPEINANIALEQMQRWQRQPLPISALCYYEQQLYIRLSGAETAIRASAKQIGGEISPEGDKFWFALREQQLSFFQTAQPLWRLGLPPKTPMLELPGHWLLDWGGAQRWLTTSAPAAQIHTLAQTHAGHAIAFRNCDKSDWLRLTPNLLTLHHRVQQAFDPYQLFNPQRLIPT